MKNGPSLRYCTAITTKRIVRGGLPISRSYPSRGVKNNQDKQFREPSRKDNRSSRATGALTLKDVAQIAGVSPITVSRVLNRPEIVAPATREIVRQAIDHIGYFPNLLAGGLASSKTRYVAAIVPVISSQVISEIIQSFTNRLWESGYQVLLGTSGFTSSWEEERLLSVILGRHPDGLVLTGIMHSAEIHRRLAAARIPIVEIWDLTPTPIDMVVGFSHEKVGQAVAECFIRLGHHSFGVIASKNERAERRIKAFLSVFEKRGITDVLTAYVPSPSSFKQGREGLRQFLEHGSLPRAVFCNSDIIAHGMLIEAQVCGIKVPGDLAIIGFGDVDFSAHTFPPLSTVRIDLEAIGRLAAEALLAKFERKPVERIIDVGFQIMERGTT